MKPETVNLLERPYQEVVDDILTAIVGGVVNEPIRFDVKMLDYPLAQPAAGIRGVSGTVNGERHLFQKEIDYLFSAGDNRLVWQEGGTLPDDDTLFYVDYFRTESRSPLTDINVGSVTRTLGEAIGREITTLYQQINRAYLSAFVETAEGTSLDLVVAILGLQRQGKEYAIGSVTFFRDPAVRGNITLPEGTRLTTTKGEVLFQTTQPRTLQQGQVRIDAPIRATEEYKGEVGKVEAGKITEMVQPVAGIDRVTNFEATFLSAEAESDEELRLRAKAALRALGKATLAALARVIAEQRAELLEIHDPNSAPAQRALPGTTVLLVDSEPERFPGLQTVVEQTRAAGVRTTLVARYVYFTPRLVVTLRPGLSAAGKEKVVREIITALEGYVAGLEAGEPAQGKALLEVAGTVEDVSRVRLVDVLVWRADVLRPNGETLAEALLTALEGIPPEDREAMKEAIAGVLEQRAPLPPSPRRIPDRSLLIGTDGGPAGDEAIEAGEFRISATVDGEPWRVMLTMQPADVWTEEGAS